MIRRLSLGAAALAALTGFTVAAPEHGEYLLVAFSPQLGSQSVAVRLEGRPVEVEFRMDVLNVFNNINFDPFAVDNSNADFADEEFGQVTTAYRDPSNTFDPGGRLGQLMFRINW